MAELAVMVGIDKRAMARLLHSNGVKLTRTGGQGKEIVMLSDLEEALPSVMDSVRFRRDE